MSDIQPNYTGPPIGSWTTLRCRDAMAQITWLEAIGFTALVIDRSAENGEKVSHAELTWPSGGGVMLGTHEEGGLWTQSPGASGCYLVTREVDAVHAAAVAAGGSSISEPADQSYGARMANVRDPEGNLWSFGDYRPPGT